MRRRDSVSRPAAAPPTFSKKLLKRRSKRLRTSEMTKDPQVQVQTRNAQGKKREGRPMFSQKRAIVQKIRKQVHRDEGRVFRVAARFEH